DLSVSGGTEAVRYYWSLGYNDNEGIRVGDRYSSVRSRLNADFQIVDWLSAGVNVQFSDRDDTSVPASLGFYVNSPFGQKVLLQGFLGSGFHAGGRVDLFGFRDRTCRLCV